VIIYKFNQDAEFPERVCAVPENVSGPFWLDLQHEKQPLADRKSLIGQTDTSFASNTLQEQHVEA
jgi:hypothetical protein